MKVIYSCARTIARASDANPVISIVVIMLFYLAINQLFATVETLIAGQRFEHFGDIILTAAFIWFAGIVVRACAEIK